MLKDGLTELHGRTVDTASSLPSTSIPSTSVSEYQKTATASLETFQLDAIFRELETEFSRSIPESSCSQIADTTSLARAWSDRTVLADDWIEDLSSPRDGNLANDSSLTHGNTWPDISTLSYPGVIETLDSSSPTLNTPESNLNGGYRCYQHGCNGRQFSSAENYRRHVREQSKSDRTTCPFCAALFTRKSNKDTHIRKGRCKSLDKWLTEEMASFLDGIAPNEGLDRIIEPGFTPTANHAAMGRI